MNIKKIALVSLLSSTAMMSGCDLSGSKPVQPSIGNNNTEEAAQQAEELAEQESKAKADQEAKDKADQEAKDKADQEAKVKAEQ
ncbi:MAG: hypothetical protein DBO98_04595 [Candidatus Liberibacter europaeus]|nr:hypothetical protein [Candidatus Liberibacter europaeus]